MDDNIIKQMPVSIEAEQAVLGSLIIRPDSYEKVGGMLSVDDFYLVEHQHIYAAIITMYAKDKAIDPVTLVNALVEQGDKDEAAGIQYISLISQSVPSAANIRDYANIVKEKSTLRHLITICDDVNREAYNESEPASVILDNAEQKIYDLSRNKESKDFRHIRDILHNVYEELETKYELKGRNPKAVKTGFSGLDQVLVELAPGDLVIVGARPGMGKTSFALNIGTNVAKTSGKSVAVFSLEMSGEQLVTRILSSEAMIDSNVLRTGQLKPEHWENIASRITELSGCNIYVDDTSAMTTTQMKSKLRRLSNLGLVIVDYIGLMESTTKSDNRAVQVGEISRNLKVMAKELGVPFICCAQLNRATESRTAADRRPTLADLRDSGSIEQDADIVMFLYRDEYYKDLKGNHGEETDDKKAAATDAINKAEVIIAKNRHGSIKNVEMAWIGQYTKFRTIEDNHGFDERS